MISAISLLIAVSGFQAPLPPAVQALSLQPTDDIWVYGHAGDPEKDEFLRAWGSEGRAVAGEGDDEAAFSYSLMRWDLSGCPKGAKLTSAKLLLTHLGGTEISAAAAKAAPLEARRVPPDFAESGWNFDKASSARPGAKLDDVFGVGSFEGVPTADFKIEIDLLAGKGDFAKAFVAACDSKDMRIGIALTSAIDPQDVGMKGIYKVFSKDAKTPEFRPALKLEFKL